MNTKTEGTIEDLYRVEGQAELVNDKIVRMPLHVGSVAYAISRILFSLHKYVEHGKKGQPFGSTVAYTVDLPHRKAFCPDAAFYTGSNEFSMKFPEGAPIFVVEVRDPHNYGPTADRKIAAKVADYFAAGTQVVWDVDVLREGIVGVYRASSPDQPVVYRRGDIAEAEPAVPGWTMPVDDLFYKPHENTTE